MTMNRRHLSKEMLPAANRNRNLTQQTHARAYDAPAPGSRLVRDYQAGRVSVQTLRCQFYIRVKGGNAPFCPFCMGEMDIHYQGGVTLVPNFVIFPSKPTFSDA